MWVYRRSDFTQTFKATLRDLMSRPIRNEWRILPIFKEQKTLWNADELERPVGLTLKDLATTYAPLLSLRPKFNAKVNFKVFFSSWTHRSHYQTIFRCFNIIFFIDFAQFCQTSVWNIQIQIIETISHCESSF